MAFATHVLLDCFTVYGTQIFWPLKTPPIMWSTIFIIDPAYSLPLLIGVLAALILTRKSLWSHAINTVCLILSTVYLLWSVGAKLHVEGVAQESLRRQNITYHKLLTVPSPFNTVLWRVLIMDDDKYHEGFYSLFDPTRNIEFTKYRSDPQLLGGIEKHWPVRRLQWFTHGFYLVQRLLDGTELRLPL
jgi:inner membrane protein